MERGSSEVCEKERNQPRGWSRNVLVLPVMLWGILALLSSVATAQSGYSGLRGNVVDTSGGIVPNAEVILTEPSTRTTVRIAETNAQGDYEFPNIKPGVYQLNADAKGFKSFVANDVVLNAGVVRRLDITFAVGGTSETVEVNAGVSVINTESGAISNSLDSQKIKDAPLIETYPSPYSLFQMMPNVQGRDWGIKIAGFDESQLSIQVNGVNNDNGGDQNNNLKFVQEATVSTVNAAADSARVVSYNLTTKRGDNAWHGSASYQHYNSALEATPHPNTKKDAFIQHDWQAELSGPIWKNHTFFYASWFQNREPLGQTVYTNVPTAAMWAGNLSGVPGIGVVKNPYNGQQFANNVIDPNLISPVAKALQQYYPTPNMGDPNVYTGNSNYKWHHKWTSPLNYKGDWPDFRIDHNISAKNTIYASWMQRLTPFVGAGTLPMNPWTRMRDSRQLTAADTHTFSAAIVNVFRFGLGDNRINDGKDVDGITFPKGNDMLTQLGIQGANPSGLNLKGGPSFSTPNKMLNFSATSEWDHRNTSYSGEDSLSWQKGRHLWKFGGNLGRFSANDISSPSFGAFTFNGLFSGDQFADFLLGLPSTSQRKDPLTNRTVNTYEAGLYVMDTFKVTQKLTLDYGLRWDYYGMPYYTDGLMYNFDMATKSIIVPSSKMNQVNPSYPGEIGNIPIVAGQPVPNAAKGNFRPRIAAAYLLNKDFVIRGGYGQFTQRFSNDSTALAANQGAGPFDHISETFTNCKELGSAQGASGPCQNVPLNTPLFSFPNPFPAEAGAYDTSSQSVTVLPQQWKDGLIHQFNVSVEKEIAKTGIRASYIGSRGEHTNFQNWTNENVAPPQAPGVSYDSSMLPFPTLSQVYVTHSGGASKYNSFQVEASRKQGWATFDTHYTFAHSSNNIGQTDNYMNPTKVWGPDSGYAGFRDHVFTVTTRWDLPFGHGRAHLADMPKSMDAVIGGWTLQTISSLTTGNHLSPYIWGDPANNNWVASTADVIPGANPNLPRNQRSQNRWFNTPVYHQLADQSYVYDHVGAFKIPGCLDNDPLCLNTSAVQIGRLGNAAPGTILGPGTNVHDLAMSKTFPVAEKVRVTFTSEISNVFNHAHFWDPDTWIQNGDVGQLVWALPDNDPSKGGRRIASFKLRAEF